jgi:hypothetical protein
MKRMGDNLFQKGVKSEHHENTWPAQEQVLGKRGRK